MRRAAVLVAALVVAGCAGSAEQADRSEPGGTEGGRDVAATMEVKVSGDSVRFILHVTNSGEVPLELTFPTSQRYDIVVQTPEGEEVWRWSEGMAFLQVISRATLAPGETWDMEAVWDPAGRSGEFVAAGVVTARDRELRQTATFELE
jgi:hypothetical protein